jgi:hypothetical protein
MSNFKIDFSLDISSLAKDIDRHLNSDINHSENEKKAIVNNCEQALIQALEEKNWAIAQKVIGVVFSVYKAFDFTKEYEKNIINMMHHISQSEMPLEQLLTTPIVVRKEQPALFKQLAWKRGREAISELFSDENINKWHEQELVSGWQAIKLALSKNILSPEKIKTIVDKYQLNLSDNMAQKKDFLLACSTLETLDNIMRTGMNVWIPINKSHNSLVKIETLLPFNVVCLELRKYNVNGLETTHPLVSFFIQNKKKWQDFQTEETSNQDFKTRLANIFTLTVKKEQDIAKILNQLEIKQINSLCIDTLPITSLNEKEMPVFRTQDELLKEGKIKILSKLKNDFTENANQSLISLLRCVKNDEDIDKINYKKAYAKLWSEIIPHVNFKATGSENLFHQLLSFKEIQAYLPMSESVLNNSRYEGKLSYDHFDKMEKNISYSLLKTLEFIEKKGCHLTDVNSSGVSALNILTLKCMENSYKNETIKKVGGFIFLNERLKNSSQDNKEKLLTLFCDNWGKIFSEEEKKVNLHLHGKGFGLDNNVFSGLKLLATIFKDELLSEELISNKEKELSTIIEDLKIFETNKTYPHDFIQLINKNRLYHKINQQVTQYDNDETSSVKFKI